MKKYLEILKKCPLFSDIDDDNILAVLGCLGAKIIKAQKDEVIFRENEPVKSFGIVLFGKVQLMRIDYYGNRSIVSNVQSSQLFAEAFACAESKSMPVSAVCAEESTIMLIECKKITTTCSGCCSFHSQLISNLLKVVARKNLLLNQRSEILSKRTTREKLLAYLMTLAKKNGSSKVSVPFNRQELADFLEVDRSGLSAEISKLRRENIIECKKSEFVLLKTE